MIRCQRYHVNIAHEHSNLRMKSLDEANLELESSISSIDRETINLTFGNITHTIRNTTGANTML